MTHRVSDLLSGCDLYTEICKGVQSCKTVDGVIVFVLSTLSDNVLYLYEVMSKYFIAIQSYGPEQ